MEIRRSVMARPNLSVSRTASSFWLCHSEPSGAKGEDVGGILLFAKADSSGLEAFGMTTCLGRNTDRRETPHGRFLSHTLPAERGGRGRFHRHLRNDSLRELCGVLGDLCGQKLLPARAPKTTQRKTIPGRRALGMPEGRGGRKLNSHYRLPGALGGYI